MADYTYLIIGGGMTADAAVKGIRTVDATGSIGVISSDSVPPYNRPALSKALWKGDPIVSDKVWRTAIAHKVDLHLSRSVTRIDTKDKFVVDDRDTRYSFKKLLLATGGRVRTLQHSITGIIYFRTLGDYLRLRSLYEQGKNFVVIGGGFIGSEVAAALAMNNAAVTMIFPEDGIGARNYPRSLSQYLTSFYASKNVTVLHNEEISSITSSASSYVATTSKGKEIGVDGIVAGIGIQPNVELAQEAGLQVENGIVVDELLRTTHPDIYAAGDVANFYNPALDKRIRVEHEDNANVMGETAGLNMAGEENIYHYLPYFYSDLFELGYEAVGELDARHEIVEDWKEEFREGVIYYLQAGRVRGVLLWNVWGQVDAARKLIADPGPFDAQSLKGRIPG